MTEKPRRTILIVDDDIDFSESLCRLLTLENYDALHADGIDSAMQSVRGQDVAVALVDIRLGAGNGGLDVVRKLRQINPDLICLMITAYVSVETVIHALQAGAYDYLSKPFHSEDLLSTLDRCFERIQLLNEQKLNAVRLQQKQHMEAIGQLACGIAHDFNNILAVLLSNLRLLEERIGEGHPEYRELVSEAIDATLTGKDLTTRMLNFGTHPGENPSVVNLAEILPDYIVILQRTFGDKWSVRLDLPDRLDRVEVLRGQLETSLLNLALNARDAMPDGGTLCIKARNLRIGPMRAAEQARKVSGDFVELTITDTGGGMSDRVRARALEPLFTTKKRGDGNGLGLAMVDNFVRAHGGWIEIESAPGQGASVTLFLPSATQTRSGGANM
ncbi:sensor histidine kinase [Roseovarius sp. M141]|uniref:sensor histidine kinase n=1 Tax=Roseovarius sp. M141 TaxID=2583806 RepID=UPI0020CC1B9F|nr:response regulator [Roseovarius sp. M141]MCQ0091862.1 response regulator [Roseovarius sp. M141]